MLKNKKRSNNFSKPIVLISVLGITLGVCVMILTLSIATGFQKEIKKKLINFDSHIQIESIFQNKNNETNPFSTLHYSSDTILGFKEIQEIQKFAYKPSILQNKSFNNNKEVQGLIFKGIDNNLNFGFFEKYLIKGKCPKFDKFKNDTIILSETTSKKLNLNINDQVRAFFISEGNPKQRIFVLGGIYKTGLEKLDNKFGFISLYKLIEINKWGTTINFEIKKSNNSDENIITCKNKSNAFLFKWGDNEITDDNYIKINTKKDTQLIVIAYEIDNYKDQNLINIPDTIELFYESRSEKFKFNNTFGSGQHYTGGYEMKLENYENGKYVQSNLKQIFGPQFKVSTIEEIHEEMFSWLNLIYQNVYIIIILMVIVAVINMSSALLVLIVEKTKMVGILKALGMRNKSIRKVFVIHGGILIASGFILGNILAIIIIAIQNHYGFLKLLQENYYLSEVPMYFPTIKIVLLNITTFILCYTSMILPSIISTKISPVKAISSEI